MARYLPRMYLSLLSRKSDRLSVTFNFTHTHLDSSKIAIGILPMVSLKMNATMLILLTTRNHCICLSIKALTYHRGLVRNRSWFVRAISEIEHSCFIRHHTVFCTYTRANLRGFACSSLYVFRQGLFHVELFNLKNDNAHSNRRL